MQYIVVRYALFNMHLLGIGVIMWRKYKHGYFIFIP